MENPEKNNAFKDYIRYSGIGFQMMFIIALFFYIGFKLDEHFQNEKRIYTLIIGLIGLGISLYTTLKKINQK